MSTSDPPQKKGPGRPKGKPSKNWSKKYPSIKATTYSHVSYLRRTKAPDLDVLDFTGFIEKWGVEELNRLYPKQKGCGKYDPPASHLDKGEKIREWRTLGKVEQKRLMSEREEQRRREEEEEARSSSEGAEDERELARAGAAAENRRKRRRIMKERGGKGDDGAEEGSDNNNNAAEEEERQQQRKNDDAPRRESADDAAAGGNSSDDESGSDADPAKSLEQWDAEAEKKNKRSSSSSADAESKRRRDERSERKRKRKRRDSPQPSDCGGICLKIVRAKRGNDNDAVERGFFHLVGNAGRYKSHVISDARRWNYPDNVAGLLVGNNAHTAKGKEGPAYIWKCVRTDANAWSFHRYGCDNSTSSHEEVCLRCWDARHNLYNSCREEVAMRDGIAEGKAVKGRIDMMKYKSPDIVLNRLEDMSRQIMDLRKSIYKLEGEKERIGVVEGEIQL